MSQRDSAKHLFITLLVVLFLSLATDTYGQNLKDLEVTVQGPSETFRAGEPFSYTATIRNVGTTMATNVRLMNDPPETVQITSVSTSAGDCSSNALRRGDAVSCSIGNMELNATVTLSFTADFAYVEDPDWPTPAPRSPHPASHDWSQGVGAISVDVIGDADRTNNVARVYVDVEPQSNGLPLVRILFPADKGKVVHKTDGRTELIVKILAYDLDGSIERVVVQENKYLPFPFIENGAYKFMYMGKKYTAAQLEAFSKKNPPPVRLARRTGKDTFEYTITDVADGPNRLMVEAYDNSGRSNYTATTFTVNEAGVIETLPPKPR